MLKAPKVSDLLIRVGLFLAPFVIFGWFFDGIWLALTIGVALLLAWHYHHLFILIDWLWHKREAYPPKARGAWADVFDGIYHQQRKHRKKRNELSLLVRRFRMGAESLPDAALVFNDDKTLVWCNNLAQRMLGFKSPEDIGNRIDNFLRHPEFIQYLAAREYEKPFEMPSPVDEGVILECRIGPFEKDKWTLIARDITQVKLMEQMRKDFIANVSHELRTPLTVMRGYLELLSDQDTPAQPMWGKAHTMMMEQTQRMDALVNQLLTLTKLENRQQAFQTGWVNVPELLQKIEQEALSLSDGRHTITFHLDPELSLMSNADQLRSAFSNIIFNAVRYTPDGKAIDVYWQRNHQGNAEFSCVDQGDGIPAEHITRITERFYRVDKARARDSGGSGLGLAIVKHVLTNHQSKLQIQSKVGQGSRFWFVIPKAFIQTTPPDQLRQ